MIDAPSPEHHFDVSDGLITLLSELPALESLTIIGEDQDDGGMNVDVILMVLSWPQAIDSLASPPDVYGDNNRQQRLYAMQVCPKLKEFCLSATTMDAEVMHRMVESRTGTAQPDQLPALLERIDIKNVFLFQEGDEESTYVDLGEWCPEELRWLSEMDVQKRVRVESGNRPVSWFLTP